MMMLMERYFILFFEKVFQFYNGGKPPHPPLGVSHPHMPHTPLWGFPVLFYLFIKKGTNYPFFLYTFFAYAAIKVCEGVWGFTPRGRKSKLHGMRGGLQHPFLFALFGHPSERRHTSGDRRRHCVAW